MHVCRESWLSLLQQLSSGHTSSQLAAETIKNLTKYGSHFVCCCVYITCIVVGRSTQFGSVKLTMECRSAGQQRWRSTKKQ